MTDKRETGSRYGRYQLRVIRELGQVKHQVRTYRLVEVETRPGGRHYLSLRLYNPQNHFIKQLLFEPQLAPELAELLKEASRGNL